ncbi:hypothetical protein Dsin_026801 [Dipteronia sinensis]|uniref:Reverse transcriptase zinc-binding domain-containing protein n=1 Tax=Dipteronia sinensis TaxID=43782 RepID=A0AAD9ZYK6_9ROSI|nr:hypothetical protein Dsin_026801 [Dipteronia sinensis]
MQLRRRIFDWEVEQWMDFKSTIDGVKIRRFIPDTLAWSFCPNGYFSVRSFRRCIKDVTNKDLWEEEPVRQEMVPSKVEVFMWKLLRGRVMVKERLAHIGMPVMFGVDCSMCRFIPESINHLFLNCSWSWKIVSDSLKAVTWVNKDDFGNYSHVNTIYDILAMMLSLVNTKGSCRVSGGGFFLSVQFCALCFACWGFAGCFVVAWFAWFGRHVALALVTSLASCLLCIVFLSSLL